MQAFRKLLVWQKAHALIIRLYAFTKPFPSEERFELVRQIRTAAVSIAANIAEGSRRAGAIDFARFLNTAQSSAAEVEYYLILSGDLAYGDPDELSRLQRDLEEVQRMLDGLRKVVLKRATEEEQSKRQASGKSAA